MNTLSDNLITYIALTLAIIFWGLSFVATKVALESFTPFCLIFLRFISASLFFIFLLKRTGFPRLDRKNLKNFALLALFQPGLYFTFETLGLQYTTATKTSLIIATIPIVVLVLSIVLLRERAGFLRILSIFISMAGVALLVFGNGFTLPTGGMLIGDLLITGAVLSAAVYMIITRKLGQTNTPLQITGMQIIMGAIIFFPLFLYDLPNIEWSAVSRESLIALVGLTIFATIGAFICYNYALTKIPAASAAICLNGIPVVTACGAWFLLGESLTPIQLAGGMVVLVSVILANHSPRINRAKA